MPFAISIPVAPISQDEFYALDHRMMAMAFAIHNEVGRFCEMFIGMRFCTFQKQPVPESPMSP